MDFYSEKPNQSNVKGGDELKNTKMVKFDIQHFAEGAHEPPEPNAAGNEPATEPTPPTPPTNPGADTFSKEDFLKDLGVENEDALKAQMKAYKEFQDGQKTEADKQAEALQAAQDQAAQALNESVQKDWQIAALKNGVLGESLNDVIALAEKTGEKDVDKAVAAVLDKYPFFSEAGKQKPVISTGNQSKQTNLTETTADKFKSAFEKNVANEQQIKK